MFFFVFELGSGQVDRWTYGQDPNTAYYYKQHTKTL